MFPLEHVCTSNSLLSHVTTGVSLHTIAQLSFCLTLTPGSFLVPETSTFFVLRYVKQFCLVPGIYAQLQLTKSMPDFRENKASLSTKLTQLRRGLISKWKINLVIQLVKSSKIVCVWRTKAYVFLLFVLSTSHAVWSWDPRHICRPWLRTPYSWTNLATLVKAWCTRYMARMLKLLEGELSRGCWCDPQRRKRILGG